MCVRKSSTDCVDPCYTLVKIKVAKCQLSHSVTLAYQLDE